MAPRCDTREDENGEEGSCKKRAGSAVHDERAGGMRAARSGTAEPVPDALDFPATESAITAKSDFC